MQTDTRIVVKKAVSRDDVFDALRDRFSGAGSIRADGGTLVIRGIPAKGFGANICSSEVRVKVEEKGDKVVLAATTHIGTNFLFWVLLVAITCFFLVGPVVVPLAYMAGKGKVVRYAEAKLREAADELG